MTFIEFNQIVNPMNSACYIATIPGKPSEVCTFAQIRELSKTEPMLTIHWMPTDGYIVITTKMLTIIPTVGARAPEIFAYKDDDTLYVIAQSDFARTTTNNMLACGVAADTYFGKKGQILLPFKNKRTSASPILAKMDMITTGSEIKELPLWLRPARKISNTIPEGIDIPITSNTQLVLKNLTTRLKTLDRFQQQEVITFINQEFCSMPCTKDELENILHIVEDETTAQFFDKNTFLHNKMGDYLIEHCHLVRDQKDKELYFYDAKKNIYITDEDYLMGYMTKLCPSLKQHQREEVIKYVTHCLYDEAKPMNEDPFTIVFKNGILNLRDMILKPMTPENYESIRINANYNPKAHSATVDEFFNTATNGDSDMESLLYEAMGYAMLKTAELQKGFILTGSGRNGKSTYLDLVKAVLGKQNTTAVSFKDLSNNFRASQLKGKLASLAGDISSQPISDSDLVKSITSGEDITIEQKYKDAHQEAVFATLFFACNKLPRTPDTSDGFYRRWAIIPFVANLSKISRVKGMTFKSELLKQEALDYAAYRAVHAIKRVLETTEEFTEPTSVKLMMAEYKTDNSSVLSFIKDEFEDDLAKLIKLKLSTVYSRYCTWANDANRGKLSLASFRNAMKAEVGIDFAD